jgi:hypothetical protein
LKTSKKVEIVTIGIDAHLSMVWQMFKIDVMILVIVLVFPSIVMIRIQIHWISVYLRMDVRMYNVFVALTMESVIIKIHQVVTVGVVSVATVDWNHTMKVNNAHCLNSIIIHAWKVDVTKVVVYLIQYVKICGVNWKENALSVYVVDVIWDVVYQNQIQPKMETFVVQLVKF